MSSAAPRGAAAAAGCVLLVVCVAWSGAPGGRAVLGTREARLQQLNLGGYDGSGDQSAFAPAGYGMDAQTAVDDDESITSSVEKMLHPPKPKLKPVQSGVVEGKDGQRYDSIPAGIMAKFRQARMEASDGGPGPAVSNAVADKQSPDTSARRTSHASADSSGKPPAWVLAEAEKLQAAAATEQATAVTRREVAPAVQRSQSTTHSLDTYEQYKAEYEASLKAKALAPTAVARRGATRTEVVAARSGGVKETAAELGRLQERVARQQDEREDELQHLASDVQALTKAVIAMKAKQAAKQASRAQKRARGKDESSGTVGAPLLQQSAADRKAEWDAMQSGLKASARGRRVGTGGYGHEQKSKMSFFGLMRQQEGRAQSASAAPPHPVQALGDNDDLSVGYREQEERDAADGVVPHAAVAPAANDAHSKLSFFAQMRNRQDAAGRGGAKMAALHRIFARTAAGGFLNQVGGGKEANPNDFHVAVARNGRASTARMALSARAPVAQCVAPRCTCVPPGNQAMRVANSPLALTQLHGLGAEAHCVFLTVHGPNGHPLNVQLTHAGEHDARWSNYGSVPTGCISTAALASGTPQLAVQDTVTGDKHTFGLGACS